MAFCRVCRLQRSSTTYLSGERIKLALIQSGADSNCGAPATIMRGGQRQTQTAILSSTFRTENGNGNVA